MSAWTCSCAGRAGTTPGLLLLLLLTPAMLVEGYDLGVMGLIVPELVGHWHVTHADLVPVLSAGVFGLFVGAPVLGYVSDRIGRKPALLICLGSMGGFSLLNMFATTLTEFAALRFLTCAGLGGLSSVVVALAAEAAPPRLRGLFIIVANFGVPAGVSIPGWTAALLVPRYGWTALLLVGGAVPLAIGVLCLLFLRAPAGQDRDRAAGPSRGAPVHLGQLFGGGFAVITPMLWLLLAANQFANFFTLSWLPTLLQSSGLSAGEAGAHSSAFAIGGVAGGVVLSLLLDRFGTLPLVALCLLGAPAVAAIGAVGPASPLLLLCCLASAGFCVTGNNFGVNAVAGMAYPTQVRSVGAGTAHAFGRVGALAAQVAGAWLLAGPVDVSSAYLLPAGMLLVGAVAAGALSLAACRQFGGVRLQDRAAAPGRVGPELAGARLAHGAGAG